VAETKGFEPSIRFPVYEEIRHRMCHLVVLVLESLIIGKIISHLSREMKGWAYYALIQGG